MATGIQTGMRTGSRSALSGRGGGAPGGGGEGFLDKIMGTWNSLGSGAKAGVIGTVVLTLLCVGGFMFHKAANTYVPIFERKLTVDETQEVSNELNRLGVPHQIALTKDEVLVHPSQAGKAKIVLQEAGLPRQPLLCNYGYSLNIEPSIRCSPRSYKVVCLEGDITLMLRNMRGIADANVKLALPRESYFKDTAQSGSATVFVKLDHPISAVQVRKIVNLVSVSVRSIPPDGVKVIDRSGRILSDALKFENISHSEKEQQDILWTQAYKEARLESKMQQKLDDILGRGQSTVSVCCEVELVPREEPQLEVKEPCGTGSRERRRQDNGKKLAVNNCTGAVRKEKTALSIDLRYSCGQGSSVHERLIDPCVERAVRGVPEVKRLTVSVMVNNLQEDQVARIAGFVKAAVGFDATRGDEIMIENLVVPSSNVEVKERALSPMERKESSLALFANHFTIMIKTPEYIEFRRGLGSLSRKIHYKLFVFSLLLLGLMLKWRSDVVQESREEE